jgi:hypothetical protein
VTGEYFEMSESEGQRYVVYEIVDESEREALDIGPTTYKELEKLLTKKPAKPKERYSFRDPARMPFVLRRSSELMSEGKSRSEAMKQACAEWKAGAKDREQLQLLGPNQRPPRNKSVYTRNGEAARVASHNDKMRERNDDQRPAETQVMPAPDNGSVTAKPTQDAQSLDESLDGRTRRAKWVKERKAELIRQEGLSAKKAYKRASQEYKGTFSKTAKIQQERNSVMGQNFRKGQDLRISAHNKKMQEWNGKQATVEKPAIPDAGRIVCPVCSKNPVVNDGEMCPECEAAFEGAR